LLHYEYFCVLHKKLCIKEKQTKDKCSNHRPCTVQCMDMTQLQLPFQFITQPQLLHHSSNNSNSTFSSEYPSSSSSSKATEPLQA